jgi:hypothetical protein
VMNRQAEEAVNRSGGSVELAPPNHVDIPRIVNGNS